jgi:hypothetical protein
MIAFVASVFGFGNFELFGGWTIWLFQAMVLISVVGLYISYRKHRCFYPLLTAIASGLLIIFGFYFNDNNYWEYFLYAGMFGLLVSTIWNYKRNKLHTTCDTCVTYDGKKVELDSTITCPTCRHKKVEIMPTNSCVYFYVCEKCKTQLKPLKGDCCVYCSYGTIKCPPIQVGTCC